MNRKRKKTRRRRERFRKWNSIIRRLCKIGRKAVYQGRALRGTSQIWISEPVYADFTGIDISDIDLSAGEITHISLPPMPPGETDIFAHLESRINAFLKLPDDALEKLMSEPLDTGREIRKIASLAKRYAGGLESLKRLASETLDDTTDSVSTEEPETK